MSTVETERKVCNEIQKSELDSENVISPVSKAIPDISYQSARRDCKINIFRGILPLSQEFNKIS